MRNFTGNHGFVGSQLGGSRRGIPLDERMAAAEDYLGTPVARRIQEGVTVQRLPDVAFQPEGAMPFHFVNGSSVCNLYDFSLSTNWHLLLEWQVPKSHKMIVTDAKILWSNMFVPGIVDSGYFIDGRMLGNVNPVEVPQNPSCCTSGLKFVVYESEMFAIKIRRLADGWDFGDISVEVVGWLVNDKFPQDERMQK